MAYDNFYKIIDGQKTKITTTFYTTIKIQKRCQACNYPGYYFEALPVINLILDLDNCVTKNVLFEEFKYHLIKKENEEIKEICSTCADGEEKKKIITNDIYYTSQILIININREKDTRHEIKFKYPESFNSKTIFTNNKNNGINSYNLISVIKKDGGNNPFNFIAYCKNFINNNWYSYNNEQIKLVQDYKNEIFDEKNTHLLIYAGI